MEVLLKLNDNAAHDSKGDWKRGDIFSIKSDGFIWGKEECEPIFTVVKFPGINPGACQFLLGPWLQNNNNVYRRSMWYWDFDSKCFYRKSDKLKKTEKDLR